MLLVIHIFSYSSSSFSLSTFPLIPYRHWPFLVLLFFFLVTHLSPYSLSSSFSFTFLPVPFLLLLLVIHLSSHSSSSSSSSPSSSPTISACKTTPSVVDRLSVVLRLFIIPSGLLLLRLSPSHFLRLRFSLSHSVCLPASPRHSSRVLSSDVNHSWLDNKNDVAWSATYPSMAVSFLSALIDYRLLESCAILWRIY